MRRQSGKNRAENAPHHQVGALIRIHLPRCPRAACEQSVKKSQKLWPGFTFGVKFIQMLTKNREISFINGPSTLESRSK
jgi:hypothetical protein